MDHFNFYDKKHNTSSQFHGFLKHKSFRDIIYNLTFKSDSLYVLNTQKSHNENYYGQAFIGGELDVDGDPEKVTLNIDAQAKDGSKFMLPLSNSKKSVLKLELQKKRSLWEKKLVLKQISRQ